METNKSEIDELESSSKASNASLLRSMLQRLSKDDSSRSLHLSSLGERPAEENSLSGGDNDQEASSRKFNTQGPARKQGNVEDSPTVIPKWERRQLFLRPFTLDTFGSSNQDSEDEDQPPGELNEHLQASVTVSEDVDVSRMSDHEIQSLNEDSFQNKDKCNSGTVESVSRENTENDIYEDVLPLSSKDEILPDPSSAQSHKKPTLIPNTSCYRVRKVTGLQADTKSCLVTSRKTWSDDQQLKTHTDENSTDSGMDSVDMKKRYSRPTHTTSQDPSLTRGVTGSTGSNTSLGKVQDKWKNTADTTDELKEIWREKGESSQDKESLYLEPDPQSVEEAMISPATFYEEQKPREAKTHLQRAFTFRDFKLDLGSMSLMDEVFTGDEWSKYLPVQKCPSQEEDTDHLQTSNVQTCNDNELSMTANPEHHGLRPESHSGSGHSCEDTDLQRTVMEEDQDDSGVESSTYIYAIQTEDGGGANTAEKRTNPSGCHEDSEGVYDYVEYMIPMPSHWHNSKSTPFLDFSVVKSQELLDNSMLKSRISLGKKRKHRPPGKRKKEKSNSIFYNIPSSVVQPPPQLMPSARTPSPSPKPAVFSSSVFYTRPSMTDSQESMSSQSMGSVTEKSKPKWKAALFPKKKGKSKH